MNRLLRSCWLGTLWKAEYQRSPVSACGWGLTEVRAEDNFWVQSRFKTTDILKVGQEHTILRDIVGNEGVYPLVRLKLT